METQVYENDFYFEVDINGNTIRIHKDFSQIQMESPEEGDSFIDCNKDYLIALKDALTKVLNPTL